jgi:hypothetical protein
MDATYNPHDNTPPRPRRVVSYQENVERIEAPTRSPGKLARRDPPLSPICREDLCMLASSKDTSGKVNKPACAGRCKLLCDRIDPMLPKPPSLPTKRN